MNLRVPSLARPATRFGHAARYRVAALTFAMFAAAGCGDDPDPVAPADPIDITLSESSITLVRSRNETRTVTAEVTGTANTGISWTVHNPNIATISANGLVTPVADGSTFATARSTADPSVNRSVVINVVSTIVTSTPAASFSWVGGPTRQLTVAVQNNDNTNVTWHTSNPAVATVSSTGVVTPVGAGTAEVYAQSVGQPEKRGTTNVTIDPAPHAYTPLAEGQSPSHTGAAGASWFYVVTVPVGATNLTASIAGANTQDADIYLYSPTATAANIENLSGTNKLCSPWTAGSTETCTLANPQSRNYYVVVNAYTAISNVTVAVDITP